MNPKDIDLTIEAMKARALMNLEINKGKREKETNKTFKEIEVKNVPQWITALSPRVQAALGRRQL